MSSRMILSRAASLSVRSRPITSITQTTVKQTTTVSDDPNVAAAAAGIMEGVTETFTTSEMNKLGVVTQKEVIDGDGKITRQTIPPSKWDADLASTSEEIVKAERSKGKDISMEKLQQKSLKGIEEKEKKMANAKKNNSQE